MLELAFVVVSILLIVIGIKGFTKGGLSLSQETTLTGKPARIVGTICIILGICFVPLGFLFAATLVRLVYGP